MTAPPLCHLLTYRGFFCAASFALCRAASATKDDADDAAAASNDAAAAAGAAGAAAAGSGDGDLRTSNCP